MELGDTVKVKYSCLSAGGLVGTIVDDFDDSRGFVRVQLKNGNTIGLSKTDLVVVSADTQSDW